MTIVTPQPRRTEKSAARLFWDDQMGKYPKIHGVLSILASVFGYIFNGHIVLGAAKWGITVGGRIATSILFFAALWVAGRSTEPTTLAHVLSYLPLIHLTASQVDHVAILSFTLLPEVLLLGAGLTTIEQWVGVRQHSGIYWVWALTYSLLTALFLGITVYTFTSFLINGSASAVISASGKADGTTLIRALTGWSYALLELLHTGVSTRYGSAAVERIAAVAPMDIQATISQAIDELAAQLRNDQARLVEALARQQEQRLGQMDFQQQHTLAAIQEVKKTIPAIDVGALSEAVTTTFEARFEARVRQLATTSEAKFEALHEAIRRNEAPGRQQKAKASASPVGYEAKTISSNEASSKVVNLARTYSSREALLAEVYSLANVEKLSSYDIAERVGKPAKTIQRWLRNREAGAHEAPHEIGDGATGTEK